MTKAMVNGWTHDHHRPHPETSSSGQKKEKKDNSCTVVGLHLFMFFYEWKDFPKISGPTCRMNVMLIATDMFSFPPTLNTHGIITFILSEPVIGNKSFLYVHGLGITEKVPCGVFQLLFLQTCMEDWNCQNPKCRNVSNK